MYSSLKRMFIAWCLGQRATHSLAAVADNEFNQRKGLKLKSLHHRIRSTRTLVICTHTRQMFSTNNKFLDPGVEMLNLITLGKHWPQMIRLGIMECVNDKLLASKDL